MDNEIAIPVMDAPENPAYGNVDLEDLLKEGHEYYGFGRLTLERLGLALGALTSKWYKKRREFSIQAQLVIPPELIFRVVYMFRKDGLTEQFITRLIDRVWIDTNIEATGSNCPWYLLASLDFVIGEETSLEGIYYSAGTAP